MNESEELKFLKRRVFLLETQVENISRLFEVQAQEMSNQNTLSGMYCKQCGVDASCMNQGSCASDDCPCGLN